MIDGLPRIHYYTLINGGMYRTHEEFNESKFMEKIYGALKGKNGNYFICVRFENQHLGYDKYGNSKGEDLNYYNYGIIDATELSQYVSFDWWRGNTNFITCPEAVGINKGLLFNIDKCFSKTPCN